MPESLACLYKTSHEPQEMDDHSVRLGATMKTPLQSENPTTPGLLCYAHTVVQIHPGRLVRL